MEKEARKAKPQRKFQHFGFDLEESKEKKEVWKVFQHQNSMEEKVLNSQLVEWLELERLKEKLEKEIDQQMEVSEYLTERLLVCFFLFILVVILFF